MNKEQNEKRNERLTMKKTKSLLTAALLAGTLLFGSCASDPNAINPPSGMTLSCDPEVTDYYFFVPEEWTVDLTTSASGAYYSNSDPSSVSMIVWETEHADSTLDDWWEANVADLQLVFQNFALESQENATMDGKYAQRYVYTVDLGENHYKIMQIGALNNGKIFLFTYTSLVDSYDAHLEDVEKITENIIIK